MNFDNSIFNEIIRIPYNGKCWRGLNLAKWPETATGEFIGDFLIWRLTLQSPNRQIKTTAKISRYTVIRYGVVLTVK